MPFDNVPWFVGGGAQHSPEVARLLAYASTGGAEGIVTPGDMKVTPLAVPGSAVTVLPGAALILNRGAGGAQQTYAARLPVADDVQVAPTGSAAGRTDLIVAQIEDPYTAGEPWQAPSNPAVGPYVFIRVISGVPAGTTRLQDVAGYGGRSAVTLARVTLPASTGTVTAAMITDLRKVAIPRKQRIVLPYALVTGNTEKLDATGAAGEVWPDATPWNIEVPSWATRANVIGTWSQVKIPPGNCWGALRVRLGDSGTPAQVYTQEVGFDTPSSAGNSRDAFIVADNVAIPASLRGRTIPARLMGRIAGGSAAAYPVMDANSAAILDIEFLEQAV